jgi:ketosteroid isomerase-like protein
MSAQGQTTGQNVEQEIRRLDGEIGRAIVGRDIAILDALVSSGYTHTNPLGEVFSKEQIAGAIQSGTLDVESYDTDDVTVHVFGDAAVVTGRAKVKGRLREQDITGQYRYTRTYVKQGGGWQVAATQLTGIAQR